MCIFNYFIIFFNLHWWFWNILLYNKGIVLFQWFLRIIFNYVLLQCHIVKTYYRFLLAFTFSNFYWIISFLSWFWYINIFFIYLNFFFIIIYIYFCRFVWWYHNRNLPILCLVRILISCINFLYLIKYSFCLWIWSQFIFINYRCIIRNYSKSCSILF